MLQSQMAISRPDIAAINSQGSGDAKLKLGELTKGTQVVGIDPTGPVTIVSVDPAGEDAVSVFYKAADGVPAERMLFRSDEPKLAIATVGRPWGFDADGAAFKLATESMRIKLAHLFDPMMAVHTSNVEPLPHQISAVYESMLPRQPLRYILADDPGAGKTIMAGLLIRKLPMRAEIDSWIKQKSMEGFETSREQGGDAAGQPNNGERK